MKKILMLLAVGLVGCGANKNTTLVKGATEWQWITDTNKECGSLMMGSPYLLTTDTIQEYWVRKEDALNRMHQFCQEKNVEVQQ